MNNDVLKYIDYLNTQIERRPQCFLVAMMIKVKFDEGVLYYNNNHFIIKIGDKFYDWEGEAECTNHTRFPEGWGDNWIVSHHNAIIDWVKNED